jgi:metacaspase-1
MAQGRSIHIGLNFVDPAHYDGWDGELTACEADAESMEAIAERKDLEPRTMLLRSAATSSAVIAEIEKAAQEMSAGDFLFVTYSGHGGQVPDKNDEPDRTDETWVLYNRQLVDDELYALWAKFKPGVRIFVLSDSCHSGSVVRKLDDPVPNPVSTRQTAAQQEPRFRAMPRDVMLATYQANKEEYDTIQESVPSSQESAEVLGATVLLISGCQDDELSLDGFENGLFTGTLLDVWDKGSWRGNYRAFHQAILGGMPTDVDQHPNKMVFGSAGEAFEQQEPLQVD